MSPNTFSHIGIRTDLAPLDQVITAKEAATFLGVSPRYIQQQCKIGKYHCRYADGIWLILKSSINKEKANS